MKNEQNNEPGLADICGDVVADGFDDFVGIFAEADAVEAGFFLLFSPLLILFAALGVLAKLVTVLVIFVVIGTLHLVGGLFSRGES